MPKKMDPEVARGLLNLSVFIAVLFVLLGILRFTLEEQIEYIGLILVERFGYAGMFLATLFMDTFIVPVSPDVILFVAIAGEVNPFRTLFVISLASILGGHLGLLIGRSLGHSRFVKKRIAPYEERGTYLMRRYGLWAMIIGAMTPIPFSAVCWLAGMLEMKYPEFLIGASFRIPRFLLWYLIIGLGFRGFTG